VGAERGIGPGRGGHLKRGIAAIKLLKEEGKPNQLLDNHLPFGENRTGVGPGSQRKGLITDEGFMTKITVPCPKCPARWNFDEAHRGKKGKCPKCGATLVIAGASMGQPVAGGATAAPVEPAPKGPDTAKERPRGADGIPRDWEPGDVIALPGTKDGYAEGGMGRVNLVRHRGWGKDLAVKSVLPAKSASARDIENFKTEAEQWVDTIGLHPNIVACHYVRELGGVPRVFIEYVDGGSLAEWIVSKRLYVGGPEAALERILDVAIQTAWGLHYVHELGLIHQDVKPLNVMMTADGVAKVTDFGLTGAKAIASGELVPGPAGQTLLATGAGMMTPAFCSPEQANIMAMKKGGTPSERWPKLTRRTDIWSWAASVLNMFLGRIAWPAGQVAHVGLQREPDDPCNPKMPHGLMVLLQRCFERDPAGRPHDMLQLVPGLQLLYRQATGKPYPREQPKPDDLLADSFNNRAVSLFDLGKKAEAEKKWHEALRVDPRHPEATYNWGLIQWRSLRMTDEKLLVKLREVRVASADSARVDYLMGLVHLERTDAQAAVQLLSKAVQAGTDRAGITSALALAQSMGDPSKQLSRTFEGHTDSVTSVSWSPDGRCALSGSSDKTLRLWEVSSGKCLRTFEGHTDRVNSVSWSPDGHWALSGSDDKTLRLWEVSSGKYLRTFEGHTSDINSVSWSPDGHWALSGSDDKTLRLWEVSSGKCLRIFEGHTGWVTSVSWSPDGRCALSGSFDKTLRLWEVSSGKCLRIFEGHTGWVTSVSWSPDGHWSLSGGEDKTLRLWEASSGECLRIFEGHTDLVTSVSWSPDGSCALSGSRDNTLRLWTIAFAKQPVPLVTSVAFAVNSALYHHLLQQVRDALASNPAGAVTFFQQARQHPGCSRRPDTMELARLLSRSLAHCGFVEGWEKRTFEGHKGRVTSVLWGPDGRCALSGSEDKTLRLWEMSSGKCLRTFEGHTDRVNSVSWSPDGRCALSGSEGMTLRLWEVSSGKCLRTFEGHTDRVNSVSWSPDGHWALSGSSDKTLRLWEVSSGQCLRRFWSFKEHMSRVTSVSWNPDGRYALSGCEDRTLRLWEVSSGKCLRSFKGHTDNVTSVSWSPDGRCALSGSDDKTLRLWEVSSGECLRTFEGHTEEVNSVSWSPDGSYALSGSRDHSMQLWEVSSGKCLRTFRGHTHSVESVSWSPDGRCALSGSADHTLLLWELDWDFEQNQPADWDEGARHFLTTFLTAHTPYTDGLVRQGKPTWTEDDFRRLLDKLGCAGYGWLRRDGVYRELQKIAAAWQGPPPLV